MMNKAGTLQNKNQSWLNSNVRERHPWFKVIQKEMKLWEREVRDSVCLKLKLRQVAHKGTVKPEADADIESQKRVI